MSISKMKKLSSILMACVLLVVLIGSYTFIAGHMRHDCIGEDCPICAELEMAENTIMNLGTILAFVAVVLLLCASAQEFTQVYHIFLRKDTLIRLKVELLN